MTRETKIPGEKRAEAFTLIRVEKKQINRIREIAYETRRSMTDMLYLILEDALPAYERKDKDE